MLGRCRTRWARRHNAVRSPTRRTLGTIWTRVAAVSVRNVCSDAVSRASSPVAARKRSGSASLWMVRTVCRYWPSSDPVV